MAALTASLLLVHKIRRKGRTFSMFHNDSESLTIVIEEYQQHDLNQMFKAAHNYLSTVVNNSNRRANEAEEDKKLVTDIPKDQEIPDVFREVEARWKMVLIKVGHFDFRIQYANAESEIRSYELTFHKKHKDTVLNSYLPYILERKEARNVGKFQLSRFECRNCWEQDNTFDHSLTFKTLALDSELKKIVCDGLNIFAGAKELYARIGRSWSRTYLLCGPAGSGKSGLITAMANHLNYDIYELEKADLQYYSNFNAIPNKSILVIKDIDRVVELQSWDHNQNQIIEQRLLHATDGLWLHCDNQRIIIFTATHERGVNPALLRPGRIDMHINMSYCGASTFKQLASRYIEIKRHKLFQEIEGLIEDDQVTQEDVLGELIKASDVGTSFHDLV